MSVAHRGAQLTQVEAGIEPLTMPHLRLAIQLRELRIHLPPRMPQQPGDRIRMPTRVRVQCPCGQGVYKGFRLSCGSACGFTQNIAGIHCGSFIRGKSVYHQSRFQRGRDTSILRLFKLRNAKQPAGWDVLLPVTAPPHTSYADNIISGEYVLGGPI